jgi:hypothetical protein
VGKLEVLKQIDGVLEGMKQPHTSAFEALAQLEFDGESCFLDKRVDWSPLVDQKEALAIAIEKVRKQVKVYGKK